MKQPFKRITVLAFGTIVLLAGVTAFTVEWNDDKHILRLPVEIKLVDIPVKEPSGIAYDPQRKSLFVVSDEGYLAELSPELKLIKRYDIMGDLEGVAVHPTRGTIFVASEGENAILEYDVAAQRIVRQLNVDWSSSKAFKDKSTGNKGIEGVCFAPSVDGPLRLLAIVESKPARLIELQYDEQEVLPAKISKNEDVITKAAVQEVKILRDWDLGLKRLSDVTYSPELKCLLIPSAKSKLAVVLDLDGVERLRFHLPGDKPEGLAFLPSGDLIVVQDSGGAAIMKQARQALTRVLSEAPVPSPK